MLRKCLHGGGDNCSRQGGDGSLQHKAEYVHPYPTIEEAGHPVGDFIQKAHNTEETYSIADFTIGFDEDNTSAIMSLEISKGIDLEGLLKSLYEFDFDTEDGAQKLIELVPVLDPEILVKIVEKLWPGYAVEDADPELLRAEVKGYLLDYLGEEDATI
jgi:hypothetical protein